MAVMRSVLYVPGNNEKMIGKASDLGADIVTLDLEDSVPPAEKAHARAISAAALEDVGSGGAEVYVRLNNWETLMTDDDLEAVVQKGLHGVTLAKCGHPDDVKRLDWKLDELERRRGIARGSIKISILLETAKGAINAYPCLTASPRMVSAIFGAVDFTKDMRVKLTSEGEEQKYARRHIAVACSGRRGGGHRRPLRRLPGHGGVRSQCPRRSPDGLRGPHDHPPQPDRGVQPHVCPDPVDVEWAKGVVKAFEEEAIAKGSAAISYNGKMVDTPVYLGAKDILAAHEEIETKNESRR